MRVSGRKAVDYVRAVADFAAAAGAATIIVAPSAVMKTAPLASRADERKWAIESIREGGQYAASVGVDVSLEPWNRYETYFLNRLDQAIDLLLETGLENGGVMGDTFHMNIEEASIPDALRSAKGLLNHVHLADSNRAVAGRGHTDFKPILQALLDIDYDGYLSFEVMAPVGRSDGNPRRCGTGVVRRRHEAGDRASESDRALALVRARRARHALLGDLHRLPVTSARR